MKILVSGSGGQLAREIIKTAPSHGYEVEAPAKDAFNVTDFRAVFDVISDSRPDIVINCAAFNDVDRAEKNWEDAFMVNGIGVKNLACACRKYDAVLVHFSSDYVFCGDGRRPYTIADRPEPINRYGQSKLLGEELLKNHLDRHYLIRTSWVFGEGKYSFPKKVLQWASTNEMLRIVDDQISSPTYTVDLADAVMKLIRTENFGLYHMTNSGHCSRYEWVAFILEKTKWQGRLQPAKGEEFDTPARRPGFSVLDNFPIAETLGSFLPSWQDATDRFLRDEE
ncbi:MAG: dTDP-4-dehydrorhamnose reductase [Deltaproteobacteria bacterium]